MRSVKHDLVRARYFAQQGGLAFSFGLMAHLWHLAVQPRQPAPPRAAIRTLQRRYAALLAADWRNAETGVYPRELLFGIPFRQFLRSLPTTFTDAPRVLWRMRKRRSDDLPRDIDRSAFPKYYLRNFHWQTDGWLSDRSARQYDFAVEVLFGGTADVMRRMAIPPVAEAVRDLAHPRILDVACGTGRFLAQLHRALPHARLAGLDLSPYYLARARAVLPSDATLVADNAEAMPFKDGLFDVVTSVFLFHELPGDARRRVVAELHRVLRPGGTLVLLDSAQLAESQELEGILDSFQRMYHEPYYKGYLRDDLAALVAAHGFTVERAEPQFVSKLVVATK
jgi:ubiquinone/menaquinone biosynthesis C-methylase UbiE